MNASAAPKRQSSIALLKGTLYHTTAHFANDFFLSFFAPTLPVLITQLGLLKVQAGVLNLGLELTALTMPLIGRWADKTDLRKFLVFTPAVSALCMTMLGVIHNFYLLFLVLLLGGLSIYFYHAIGPADVALVDEAALGRVMAIWNIAGQVAFMIGPLVVTAVVSRWSLRQLPWLALLGVVAAVVLALMRGKGVSDSAKNISGNPEKSGVGLTKPNQVSHELAETKTRRARILRQFLPIAAISVSIALSRSCAFAYLPVYIVEKGGSLWMSGFAISLYFGAGILGNYIGGALHDRLGSRWVAAIALAGFALFFVLSVLAGGILQLALIACMGVFSFMLMPTIMAMLAENNPDDRSLTNGLFLGITYGVVALAGVAAGWLLDHFETLPIFFASAALALSALIYVPWLKDEYREKRQAQQV